LLHTLLDTMAAPNYWLMPFHARDFEPVTVPAVYSNWIWSFVLHWTFALEITICPTARLLFAYRWREAARKKLELGASL
jgi:inner membrane protein